MLRLRSINLFDCEPHHRSSKSDRKIRERLKELSQFVSNYRIVKIDFSKKWDAIFIVFNNGLISWIYFSRNRITRIYHDRYLVNKLLSEHIVNFEFRDHYALISYTLSKLTLVSFNRIPDDNQHNHCDKFKFASRNPQLCIVELDNVSTRRVERKLVLNDSGDLLIVWWKNGTNSVSPWTAPGRGLRDLSNILVYSFTHINFELITYGCVCGEIYEILFVRWNPNQIVVLRQSEENVTIVNYCIYEMNDSFESLQQIYSIHIPLLRPCLKAQFTNAQDKIVMLCDDDSITLFNIEQNALFALHSSVSAFDFTCSHSDSIFVVSDQFGRVSLYDYSFNTIQINYDDLFSDEILHLRQIKFISPSRVCLHFCGDKPNLTLITFPSNIDNKTLITEYMKNGKCHEAIAALRAINWNCYGDTAYFSLSSIFNQLLKEPLNAVRESQLEATLATFFNSVIPIDDEIHAEYKLEMHFLAKRFFYHLLRYNCMDKAFLLAIDLKSRQLFMLLHKIAKERGNERLSQIAMLKAQEYSHHNNCCADSGQSEEPNNNHISTIRNQKRVNENLSDDLGIPSIISDCYGLIDSHTVEPLPSASHQMPIASILKPSSSTMSTATIMPTKPITFKTQSNVREDHNHNGVTTSSSKILLSKMEELYTSPVKQQKLMQINGTNNSQEKTLSYFTRVEVHQEDIRDSVTQLFNNDIVALESQLSHLRSSEVPEHLTMVPPLPLNQPPQRPSPLPRGLTKTYPEPLPPALPPRTYLVKHRTDPPQLPPKTILVNNNNNSIDIKLDETLFLKSASEDSSVPSPSLSSLKSGSKIECIHFGVV